MKISKKETRKKRRTRKNVFNGRKWFISHTRGTGETHRYKVLVNDSWYNEGTICLVNGRISTGGMVIRAWAHERVPLNSRWLVLRIGGSDSLHCWVANSVWLERAGSLITKR